MGFQEMPEAALMLATPGAASGGAPELGHLAHWATTPLLQAMALMSGPAARHASVRAYALRSLHACPPEQVSL